MSKIRREDSQRESRTVNGDLLVTGKLICPEFEILRVAVEKLKLGVGLWSPVANEPSLGTLHILASPTAYNLISGAAVSNTWTDLTCSGAETGTKAVLLSVVCDFTANAAALSYGFCHLRPNGSSWGIGVCVACGFLINPAISGTKYESGAQARVPVDSSKIFEYYFENSATSARGLYITLLGCWI